MSFSILHCCLIVCLFCPKLFAKEKTMKQVRTFMSYSFPVDPVRMVSIPDMDLSYALGSTLVQWDKDKQLSGAIASSWSPTSETTYTFKIRKGLKWSDNTLVTALDIKRSFERAFKDYPEDLRSLIHLTKSINVLSDDTIEFHLNSKTSESGLLGKLTEPNYGILKIRHDGSIDLSITTGAFFVVKNTQDELILKKNPNWILMSDLMPEEVVIKKPTDSTDLQTVLLENEWPNLVETNSLLSKELMERYQKNNFKIWTRPFDKIFLFQLSKNFVNNEGPELLKYLRKNLNRKSLIDGLSGLSLTEQVFPMGYQLFDEQIPKSEEDVKLPAQFKKKPLQILVCPARVNKTLQDKIKKVITDAIGVEPQIKLTTLDKLGSHKRAGDYDIYVGTVGLADPDPEGIMSYYFEGITPIIQSGHEHFLNKLDASRKETDLAKKMKLMRSLMTEATVKGHILPLFHLSTVGIGREELDFSSIPTSDESVTLSKIRFKRKE
jgi:peptide/nickel transport system substrate-binding protein